MAKEILRVFGGGSIIIGLLIILVAFLAGNGLLITSSLYIGSGFLLFGAPLLGFARVIDLLEQIAHNTSPQAAALEAPIDPQAPRAGNQSTAGVVRSGTYLGFPHTLHGDDAVVARVNGDVMTWRNEREFKSWAEEQPAPELAER